MRRRLCTLPHLLCLALSLAGVAQTPPPTAASAACPQFSVEQVVEKLGRRNSERAQALRAYHSTRTYRVEYRGFPGGRRAEMVVDMTFGPPATKTFVIRSQTGSKLLIDRVLKKLLESEKEAFTAEAQKRTALTPDNYSFALEGCESIGEGSHYVLAVEPKIKNKFLYRGKIWVDAGDFAVARIAAEPAKNPSFWIKQTQIEQVYGKVDEFWMPMRNRSVTSVRLGGRADLTIDYQDYKMAVVPAAMNGTKQSRAEIIAQPR
ncbi:MAG: hypothetical protein ABIP81_05360 [Terriglobales bacterium]